MSGQRGGGIMHNDDADIRPDFAVLGLNTLRQRSVFLALSHPKEFCTDEWRILEMPPWVGLSSDSGENGSRSENKSVWALLFVFVCFLQKLTKFAVLGYCFLQVPPLPKSVPSLIRTCQPFRCFLT